jgi:hypothetical protein
VKKPGTWGIYLHSNLQGEAILSFVTVSDPGEAGLLNYAPDSKFRLTKSSGNAGW